MCTQCDGAREMGRVRWHGTINSSLCMHKHHIIEKIIDSLRLHEIEKWAPKQFILGKVDNSYYFPSMMNIAHVRECTTDYYTLLAL
jgi:hypothetical protein